MVPPVSPLELIRTGFDRKGPFAPGGPGSGSAAFFSLITAAQISLLYFPFTHFHLTATGAGNFQGQRFPLREDLDPSPERSKRETATVLPKARKQAVITV